MTDTTDNPMDDNAQTAGIIKLAQMTDLAFQAIGALRLLMAQSVPYNSERAAAHYSEIDAALNTYQENK